MLLSFLSKCRSVNLTEGEIPSQITEFFHRKNPGKGLKLRGIPEILFLPVFLDVRISPEDLDAVRSEVRGCFHERMRRRFTGLAPACGIVGIVISIFCIVLSSHRFS
jgi:hypothetical protein